MVGALRRFRVLLAAVALVPLLAAGARSLFYGAGYAQAQDRLWQAEIHRRLATGTLSELFGPSVLEGDVVARQLFGSAARRAALFEQASPLTRTVLEAFADGMNAWIEQARRAGTLPAPYAVFGPPRPWTVDDSVATYLYFGAAFGTFGGDELANLAQLQDLVARLGAPAAQLVFADTHWLDDPTATPTVPSDVAAGSAGRAGAPPAAAPGARTLAGSALTGTALTGTALAETARATQASISAAEQVFARFGVERAPASNAIV